MRKMFKLVALLLMLCVLFSGVVACGPKSNVASTTTQVSEEVPVSIVWKPQFSASAVEISKDAPLINAIKDKFNVNISFAILPGTNEEEALNLAIAAGKIPDVMYIGTGLLLSKFAKEGIITDIPIDRFKKFAPTLYDLTAKIGGKNVFDYYTINSKLYGLPYISPNGNYHFTPIWRDDWLKNVGITKIPETLDEAEAAFYKFAQNDPDKNGKNDTYALSNKGLTAIFGAYGANPFPAGEPDFFWSQKAGVVSLSAVLPEMKDALIKINKWYKDGLIDPEFITGENKGQYWGNSVSFWNNTIGFSAPGIFYHSTPPLFTGDLGSTFYQGFIKLQPNGTYVAGLPLSGPGGKGIKAWSPIAGGGIVFSKSCADDPKKMEKALKIIEAYHTDENFYISARFGVKDVTYIVQSNGIPLLKPEAVKDGTVAKFGLGAGSIIQLQNNHDMFNKLTYPVETIAYAKKYSMAVEGWENVVFSALPSDGQYKAILDSKVKENYALFITGQRNLNEWDKFVEDMNKSGLTQLTKEANEWYKTYIK